MIAKILTIIFAVVIMFLYIACVIAEYKESGKQKKLIEEMQERLKNAETWNELNHSLIRNYVEIFTKEINELKSITNDTNKTTKSKKCVKFTENEQKY